MVSQQLITGFIVGGLAIGIVVYLTMSIRHASEKQREQADTIQRQGAEIIALRIKDAQQTERVAALERTIETRRGKRGALYDEQLEDTQARVVQYQTRFRYLMSEFMRVCPPEDLKHIMTALEAMNNSPL